VAGVEPLPVVDPEEAPEPEAPDEPAAAAVADGAVVLPLMERAASVAPAVPEITLPEGFCPTGEVVLVAMAAVWNAEKVLFPVVAALTEKTIPA